ncbi:bifunctional (RS)-methionine sulfoxide reductase A/B [Campylobacter sp. CCUG 57310]|nr:bifunctional (RS)-methionine sulfoxide reductase A/B [Campylobacter sp. CCUG 57310]
MIKKIVAALIVAAVSTWAKGAEMGNKTIVLAGGCFWGTEAYLKQLPGVKDTYVAYANSKVPNPSYQQVSYGNTNAAEAVYVEYDEYVIDLPHLLKYFFYTIDPTSLNKQGNDRGTQYRTGIYFTDPKDEAEILAFIKEKQKEYSKPIVVEVMALQNISKAEEYHQDYLTKNPNGYCHVTFESLPPKDAVLSSKKKEAKMDMDKLKSYQNKNDAQLKSELSDLSYDVVKNSATERPFTSELNDEKREGIFVDITNGQPLFSSYDKFNSGSGWPSFTKPIDGSLLGEVADNSYGMRRVEVRTSLSDSHLGHVFDDGPRDKGGLRYCINGAALKFIPKEDMEKEGYGYLIPYLNEQAKAAK